MAQITAAGVGPLFDLVARILELEHGKPRISPAWVATAAWLQLDPGKAIQRGHPLIYIGCHCHLRQIARELLRKEDGAEDEEKGQHRLFPVLQARYPSARSKDWEDPEYVLLNSLNKEDVDYNVARLRKEGRTKLRHADALAAWGRQHFKRSGRKRGNART